MTFKIVPERRRDAALIEPLLDRAFGFDRRRKTVYRLRAGVAPVDRLRFVALAGDGIGRGLVGHGLARAKRAGAGLCVIVGEPAYYAPFGFRNASAAGLILPGPVEPERFQVLEIVPGALAGVTGLIGKAEEDGAPGRGLRDAVAG